MKELTILSDCLKYSLDPPEKVLLISLIYPTALGIYCELKGTMTLEGNVKLSMVGEEVQGTSLYLFTLEMEKDCIVSHGASAFLQERLLEQSDAFIAHVCNKCGLFAIYDFEKNEGYCKGCDTTEVSEIKVPYACKLLFQELQSMNVVLKMKLEE